MKVPRLHHFCSFSVDGSWFANFAKILVRNVVLVKAHAHHVLPDTEIDKGAFAETGKGSILAAAAGVDNLRRWNF